MFDASFLDLCFQLLGLPINLRRRHQHGPLNVIERLLHPFSKDRSHLVDRRALIGEVRRQPAELRMEIGQDFFAQFGSKELFILFDHFHLSIEVLALLFEYSSESG